MLAEFGGKMVECDDVQVLPWGPKILAVRPPVDENTPAEKAANLASIKEVCAAIQRGRYHTT